MGFLKSEIRRIYVYTSRVKGEGRCPICYEQGVSEAVGCLTGERIWTVNHVKNF